MRRALGALAFLACCRALAQDEDLFKDPQDGAFDASTWLLEKKGFLPVPTLITEPAVGYGLGVGLLFFRESIGESVAHSKDPNHLTPPDIYALFLAATENGTKLGFAGGMVTFDDDRWRWRGGVGLADVNLDFYGAGSQLGTQDRSIGYNLQGLISSQQVMWRFPASNTFAALRWVYLDLDARFDASKSPPPQAQGSLGARSSGLGPSVEYDSRDNIFTPSRGWLGAVETLFYSPDFGGDERFQLYRAYAFGYLPMGRDFVLGLRADSRTARGNVPFYQLPYIDMRGLPKTRYQDENIALLETELRWNVTPRWAVVAFVGSGRAWGTNDSYGDAVSASAWGAGFRYLIARRLGLYMGVDLARGPEETAIYIQAGSAWR